MSVMGTYCEICGLPVQLDHYVPMPGGGFWIWRDDGSDACDPAVAFGAEHAWLSRAVALRWDETPTGTGTVIEGTVEDGYLEGADGEGVGVFPDIDDWGAAHHACWQLAGRPASWQSLSYLQPSAVLEKYQQQLFDFQEFADDGHSWMLADPDAGTSDGSRSRQRILDLLRPVPGR